MIRVLIILAQLRGGSMRKLIISPEGFPYIFIGIICTGIAALANPYIAIMPLFITFFLAYFFRNPPRSITANENNLLSPADGKIMDIKKVDYDDILQCEVYKVSIFLSLFDVHVNRMPLSGTIFYKKYIPGKFFPAFKSHASEMNERNIIGIKCDDVEVLVIQITGFIARRIIDWVNIGDFLHQGSLFGLIKFGSCTEILIPSDNVDIKVKIGDKVKAGKTIIGVLFNETSNR
jgi:phosphatidylserine decarboxylase